MYLHLSKLFPKSSTDSGAEKPHTGLRGNPEISRRSDYPPGWTKGDGIVT